MGPIEKELHMQDKLSLPELRQRWEKVWGKVPHKGIGRTMLEKSLIFKTQNTLTPDQQSRLNQLTKQYKRNPKCFDEECSTLKPGTRLVRNWKGKRHSILTKSNGFEYQDQHYTSLTQIANNITGSRWNGRAFFGLKKKKAS